MYYPELELVGYKRLRLANINRIVIAPQEKLQLILGTNGSGKSSLLKELSPLPASIQDYEKDGKKRIVIQANGHRYELTSVFSPSQRHSFLKDEEELNPGGTASVQKELVKKEFNITPDVHELMTGAVAFNKMGPGERRYWFTRLSDTSYSYALGVYQKLKEKHRDIMGAIKMNQSRAVQEANKLLSQDQEKMLRDEIQEYRQVLEQLLTIKTPSKHFKTDVETELQATEFALNNLARQIIRERGKFLNHEAFTSMEMIDDAILNYGSKTSSLAYTIDLIAKDIASNQETIDALNRSNINNFQEIDTKRQELLKEIDEIKIKLISDCIFEDPVNAFQSIMSIQDTLSDILTELPSNEDKRFSRDQYTHCQLQTNQLSNQITNLNEKLLILRAQKKAMDESKNEKPVECPSCHYQWQIGYTESTYNEIVQGIDTLEKQLLVVQATQKTNDEMFEAMKQYFALYRSFSDISKTWPNLAPLWNYISNNEMLLKNPRSILYFIDRVKGSLRLQIQLVDYSKQINELNELKCVTERLETNHIEKIKIKINDLNETLFKQNEELRFTNQAIQRLKSYKQTINSIEDTSIKISTLLESQSKLSSVLVEEIKQEAINTLIRHVQLELSKREQQLSQVDVQKTLVENIQKQLKELEEEAFVLNIMVKELSPTEGLIAKGLLGFINNFVKQMNSFIRKVWLYPMELIPCLPDNDSDVDLDYKFSLQVNNNDPIPDIKLASSAMAEVINLAFVIVAMKYLGLSNAPLMLDEFAARMDSAHRSSAFNAISNLINQSEFSQIYIVSHFEDCYGSLVNADITVLCSKNIVLPKNVLYNKHTVIN